MANPKPQGDVIRFIIIRKNTTYSKAKSEIDALLAVHGVAGLINVTPGPEVTGKANRVIELRIAKDLLV